jgi:hypothetical protein
MMSRVVGGIDRTEIWQSGIPNHLDLAGKVVTDGRELELRTQHGRLAFLYAFSQSAQLWWSAVWIEL